MSGNLTSIQRNTKVLSSSNLYITILREEREGKNNKSQPHL